MGRADESRVVGAYCKFLNSGNQAPQRNPCWSYWATAAALLLALHVSNARCKATRNAHDSVHPTAAANFLYFCWEGEGAGTGGKRGRRRGLCEGSEERRERFDTANKQQHGTQLHRRILLLRLHYPCFRDLSGSLTRSFLTDSPLRTPTLPPSPFPA